MGLPSKRKDAKCFLKIQQPDESTNRAYANHDRHLIYTIKSYFPNSNLAARLFRLE